jgi:PleD family two-component response regulator
LVEAWACLLPETDPKGAFLIAERFRAAVESLGLPNPKAPRPTVTVSVGWDSRVPDYERGAESLVIPCQEWLNLAKSQGRNQVCGPQERKEDI